MFDWIDFAWFTDWWQPVEDWFTGYTSANQQFRFAKEGMSIQDSYNRANMALQDQYQRQLMLDGPSLQRQGLEKAGFNPMLAVGGGITSPHSAVSASTPSFAAPTPKGFGLGDIINAISSAFGNYSAMAKLGGDVALTHAQADATRANSIADVALKGAETAKTLKEADSIEPDIIKRHNRYGTSSFGRAIEDVTLKISDAIDINRRLNSAREAKSRDEHLQSVSTTSAKGLDTALKAINNRVLPRMRHETENRHYHSSNRRHN